MNNNSNYSAPAIDRMLDIVEFLSTQQRPFGVSELSRTLEISSNSIFRIMARLIERGYAVQDQATKGYSLTPRLFMMGNFRQDKDSLKKVSRKYLEMLSKEVGETTQIQIPAGNRMESLDVIEPKCDFYLHVTPGSKLYYHCNAYGKAILAFMNDNEVAALLPDELPQMTGSTITKMENLFEEIATIRKKGIAYDREEYSRGVYCIGAAVLDASGNAVAGLGITGMRVRFDKYKKNKYVRMVLQTARDVSRELGFTGDYYEQFINPRKAKQLQKEIYK